MVCGGWNLDTVRSTIDSECRKIVQAWDQNHVGQVAKIVVYGKRAQTVHILLTPLETETARERYFELYNRYSDTFACSSGRNIWLSPHKTVERRAKNKATGIAIETLKAVVVIMVMSLAPSTQIGPSR